MKYVYLFLFLTFHFISKAQNWEKAKSYEYISKSSTVKHVTDKEGSIYIIGEFGPDQKYLAFPGIDLVTKGNLDIFLLKLDSNFSVIWVKSFGNIGNDLITGIAIDNSGDLLICGYFTDSLNFGKQKIKSRGSSDFFLAKIDNSGEEIWIKSGGSEFKDESYNRSGGLFTDQNNNIYVSGVFANIDTHEPKATAWFDSLSVKSYGAQDIFVAKYSQVGKIEWLKNFGSYSYDFGVISLLGESIYLTGGADWQFHADSLIFEDPYGVDIGFVLKMDTSGKVQWVTGGVLTGWGSMTSSSVTDDSIGNVYLVGMYNCIDYGCKLKFDNHYLEGIGGTDVFIAKLNKGGKVKWLKKAGGYANDGPSKIITKDNNHLIIVGSMSGGGFYEDKEILTGISSFILDIDSNGNSIFFEPCGINGYNSCNDISIDNSDKLIVTGNNLAGSLIFDDLILPNLDRPSSLFVAKRDFVQKVTNVIVKKSAFSVLFLPNPADRSLSLRNIDFSHGNCSLTVYRFDGKIIVTQEIASSFTDINTSDWPEGLYMFSLKNAKSTLSKQILILH